MSSVLHQTHTLLILLSCSPAHTAPPWCPLLVPLCHDLGHAIFFSPFTPSYLLLTPCYLSHTCLSSLLVPNWLYMFGPEGCTILHPRIPVLGLTHAVCVMTGSLSAVHRLCIYTKLVVVILLSFVFIYLLAQSKFPFPCSHIWLLSPPFIGDPWTLESNSHWTSLHPQNHTGTVVHLEAR